MVTKYVSKISKIIEQPVQWIRSEINARMKHIVSTSSVLSFFKQAKSVSIHGPQRCVYKKSQSVDTSI